MKRADATRQAEEAGATVKSSLTTDTEILVAGPGAGQKIQQAKVRPSSKFSLRMISE
jgi:NAD-dependent DNA ligase